MNKRNHYRDENFERYIEQIEFALDRQLFTVSPVIDAVRRLRARMTARGDTTLQ
jgi:hypothetical protein